MPKGIKGFIKGQKFTKEHKQKLSLAHKGKIPWNKNKKLNYKPIGMKGKKHTIEWKKQTSQRIKKQWKKGLREKSKSKISKSLKGHSVSRETRQKLSRKIKEYYQNHHPWNFKDNKDCENNRIRKSLEYNIWRLEVYKKDNYTCRLCGNKKDIIAHHLKLFSEFPELRFSIDNGIVVCRKCHGKIHSNFKR